MCAHEVKDIDKQVKACNDHSPVHAVAAASLITNAFLLLIIHLTDHTPLAWFTLRVLAMGLIVFFSCLCGYRLLAFSSSPSPPLSASSAFAFTFASSSIPSLSTAAAALISFVMPNAEKRLGSLLAEREATIKTLTDALAAKSLYMATMTHELRTPMHGIISMSMELRDTLKSDCQAHIPVSIISDCADHLLSLVDNILDMEKLEAMQLELEQIPFAIADHALQVLGMVKATAEKKRVRLHYHQSVAYPVHTGDPSRFRQILLNLLSNAVKFTAEGGSVTVSLRNESPAHPERVTVVVSDTGVGIAAEHTQRLFSSFSQADSSVFRKFGGSGLGLAICKRLCENMGGSISCSSKLGHGSTFTFTVQLPVADDELRLAAEAAPIATESLAAGLRVLLVEDNPVNQKVGARMLSRLGCATQVAANGAECLGVLELDQFDVILMDCHMPVLDGFQATEEIRRREEEAADQQLDHDGARLASVPILALTASATKEQAKRCLEAGMSDVLFKPLRRETLRAALSKWTTSSSSGEASDSSDARPSQPPSSPASPLLSRPER